MFVSQDEESLQSRPCALPQFGLDANLTRAIVSLTHLVVMRFKRRSCNMHRVSLCLLTKLVSCHQHHRSGCSPVLFRTKRERVLLHLYFGLPSHAL